MEKVIGIVPARAGSKRLKNKNILLLDGETLAARAAKTLLDSGIENVYVSSDYDEAKLCLPKKAKYLKRDKAYSRDHVPLQTAIKYAINQIDKDCEYVVILMPNCPEITSDDINRGFDIIYENNSNILRTYSYTTGGENGLIIVKRDYLIYHWIDVYASSLEAGGSEIHTMDDYLFIKNKGI